jgi:hypothetical protein
MAKKILKLSLKGLDKGAVLQQYLDPSNPLFEKWEIELNNPILRFADAWCVIEDLDPRDNKCEVNPKNTYFFAAETAQNLGHIQESEPMKNFLAQFEHVYTYHQYLRSSMKSQPPFLPWMINSNHGESIFKNHKRDVNFFHSFNQITKTKLISVMCSKQELTPAHKMRLRFVEQLQDHFGADLDWFGNGINSVDEKWEALAPYQYTIALENQSRHNVITEKLGDSFLALSYPFYWGAPNANQYFDATGFSQINIEDFQGSVRIIEDILRSDNYLGTLPNLIENKNRVIHNFNFLNRILEICDLNSIDHSSNVIIIRSANNFEATSQKAYNSVVGKIYKNVYRIDKIFGTNLINIVTEIYIFFRYNNLSKSISKIKR